MDIPLEQMQAKGKETDRPPLMSNRLQEPYELLKELTHWFNILCCPQPQSRWETGCSYSLQALSRMGLSPLPGTHSSLSLCLALVLVCLQGRCLPCKMFLGLECRLQPGYPTAKDRAESLPRLGCEGRHPAGAARIASSGLAGKDAQAAVGSVPEMMCICFEKSPRFSSLMGN